MPKLHYPAPFQRLVLRGLHIASGGSLRLFHRRGKIGNGLVVLSGQKYLRLINGDLVCDPQPVQQQTPAAAVPTAASTPNEADSALFAEIHSLCSLCEEALFRDAKMGSLF